MDHRLPEGSGDDGKWAEARSYEYEYKDAYPVSQKKTEYENVVTDDFEYTDTGISPERYASMINWFLLEGDGNYYIYNWY